MGWWFVKRVGGVGMRGEGSEEGRGVQGRVVGQEGDVDSGRWMGGEGVEGAGFGREGKGSGTRVRGKGNGCVIRPGR